MKNVSTCPPILDHVTEPVRADCVQREKEDPNADTEGDGTKSQTKSEPFIVVEHEYKNKAKRQTGKTKLEELNYDN